MTPRNYFKFQQHFLIFIFALGTAWKSSQVFLERRIFSQYPKDIDGTSHDPVVVQSPSCVQLFVTPWMEAHQTSFSLTIPQSLPKFMFFELVMPSNHLILCRPLLLLSSVFPSIRVFSSESILRLRGPKDWNFSFSISPFDEHPGLISFRTDWLDLLAVPGTLKSLLQHHSSKASIQKQTIVQMIIVLWQDLKVWIKVMRENRYTVNALLSTS